MVKINFRNEYSMQEFDLEVSELEGWLNISIEEGESESAFQKRAQEVIKEEYNKPEYNIIRKLHRHQDNTPGDKDEDGKEKDRLECIYGETVDKDIFDRDAINADRQQEYERVCDFIKSVLHKHPDWADIFIGVYMDHHQIKEFAEFQVNPDEYTDAVEYERAVLRLANNMGKKLNRAKKLIEKNLGKASDFGLFEGYKVGEVFSNTINGGVHHEQHDYR